MAEDIVVPGQYNDLTRKDQLNSLNQVIKELAETVASITSGDTIVNITNTADARIQIARIDYPFL